MANKRDYYEILGVDRSASEGDLKTSYRKLAMKFHPDRNPGDKEAEERFKEASEAYEVLRDPQKRRLYDQFGHQGLEGSGFSGFGGFEDIFSSFGDIFEDFFSFKSGGRNRHYRSNRGADLRYDLKLTFMEAAFGTETVINVQKHETCSECNGMGSEPGTRPEPCSQCGGSGQISRSQGFFTVRTTCPHCRGAGEVISNPCKNCDGFGKIRVNKKVAVNIPAGVDNGSRLRLTGEGEPGSHGGPTGDLYVFIYVEPHEFFERNGVDIICKIPITFVQAALGDEITVATLKGERQLKIPKGTQPFDVFELDGEGIPSLRTGVRGKQIIQVLVKTPTGLTKKQESLLRDFMKIEQGKLSSKLKNILKGAKKTADTTFNKTSASTG